MKPEPEEHYPLRKAAGSTPRILSRRLQHFITSPSANRVTITR